MSAVNETLIRDVVAEVLGRLGKPAAPPDELTGADVRSLGEAMQKAGSTNPKKYLGALARTDYAGLTSRIQFDDKGDLKDGGITVYKVEGGQWKVMQTIGGGAAAPAAASAAQ